MGMLEGKVAIVTGAGRGLGRAEALELARHGAKVVVNDLGGGFDGKGEHHGPADEVVAEIRKRGGEAVPSYESVSDFEGARRIVEKAVESFGKLDILVNNAGILRDRMIFNMTEEDWDLVMSVHLKGTFNCTRHACAYWREQHKAGKPVSGRIINTASDAGLLYNPGQSNYGAAKAGIVAFTLIVAKEMEKYGVTSNVIVPMARTRLTTEATPSMAPLMGTPEEMEKRLGFDPLAPENAAPLVAFLASDRASGITGRVIRIVGGTVWVLDGWRSPQKSSKKGRWSAEELAEVLPGLLEKMPPAQDLPSLVAELGFF
jgi:NAD(P)-dependent dehydrogenase (short-subunit alcohol dehydrogenase family)